MSNKNGLRIAISGRSGCGNTTVSRLLAERLG
ncbi:MAG: cytidylate kinase, partial [Spirochaetes bacterium]